MNSSFVKLLECAHDADTRNRIRMWINEHVVEMGQTIFVTNREMVVAGDRHEGQMEYRRTSAYYAIGDRIRIGQTSQVITENHPAGREEVHRVWVVRP